jgi:hypothetical protein
MRQRQNARPARQIAEKCALLRHRQTLCDQPSDRAYDGGIAALNEERL